jgi:hypothetical protein
MADLDKEEIAKYVKEVSQLFQEIKVGIWQRESKERNTKVVCPNTQFKS